jgi:hypothetical protein
MGGMAVIDDTGSGSDLEDKSFTPENTLVQVNKEVSC